MKAGAAQNLRGIYPGAHSPAPGPLPSRVKPLACNFRVDQLIAVQAAFR